ncbi:PAS domain-containing protein [Terasakiella sp. A23]|uniref:PAS domain-containing protein n=1 Tax=Terasakiella sp. FCG-A23 TaxID=3080561 RepID=UPI002952B4BA|nr:PAS domain-containing protein [Terasakiella sp. A23]MDV7338224.1 PAS domain-containing protein [Terasakiella sp. A23]
MTTDTSLEALFEHAIDLLCVAGKDGYLQKVNPAWQKLLGYSEDELLSTPFLDLVHDEDLGRTINAMSALGTGQKVVDIENRYRTKSGNYVWLQWRTHTADDETGTIYAVARDITSAKNREIRAENDIRLLEMAESTARVGHWHLDTSSGFLQWSNEVFNIYGRKANKANITLDDFIDAFVGDDQNRIWQLIESAIQDGKEINTEARLLRSDGSISNVALRAVCEKTDLNVVQGLFGIIQDVTIERQHQERLRSKEELMSMAFRATSDGIWDWDLRTDQVWFSPQWKAQLGYTDDEIINRFESWADLVFEEDRIKVLEEMDKHFRGDTDRFEMVQRMRHKDGHTVFILARAEAVRNEHGQAIRMVGAHTDVTELKRLEQAKSEFTSIVSHELRTPLTAIHGAIGLLNGHFGSDLSDQAKSLVQVANNNSERLILLVNDILDMEKLQSGRMDFDLHPISLGEFLPQAVENHVSYANQFDVALDYNHEGDELSLVGDSDRLMQVMSNLLSNAIKFSNPKDSVKIRTGNHQDHVEISVIDTGRGIPKDMQHRIFEKFIQADSSDQRVKGGTGLGLAISKAMVENMNGTISLVSEVDKGSTFTVRLPTA